MNGFGVLLNLETNEKIGFGNQSLVPVLAVTDPELMLTIPAKYTAYQGFDALFHNTEVMMSKGINILSETIALSAIGCIAKYLVKLQEDCGVADLKMSDFGFKPDEAMILAKGARSMQGGLFEANPCEMTDEDCAGIFEKSYR